MSTQKKSLNQKRKKMSNKDDCITYHTLFSQLSQQSTTALNNKILRKKLYSVHF